MPECRVQRATGSSLVVLTKQLHLGHVPAHTSTGSKAERHIGSLHRLARRLIAIDIVQPTFGSERVSVAPDGIHVVDGVGWNTEDTAFVKMLAADVEAARGSETRESHCAGRVHAEGFVDAGFEVAQVLDHVVRRDGLLRGASAKQVSKNIIKKK